MNRTRKWYLAGKPTFISSTSYYPIQRGEGVFILMRKAYLNVVLGTDSEETSVVPENSINTRLEFDHSSGEFVLKLHGHEILEGKYFRNTQEAMAFAEHNLVETEWFTPHHGELLILFPTRVNLCGYPTPTTLNRLRQFNVNIFKKRGRIYLVNELCEIESSGWFNLVIPAPQIENQPDMFLEGDDELPF